MPKYQFHRLPEDGRAQPVEMTLFDDGAAMRRAIGETFPNGCDVWQDHRYVGRFHRAVPPEPPAEPPAPIALKPVVAGA